MKHSTLSLLCLASALSCASIASAQTSLHNLLPRNNNVVATGLGALAGGVLGSNLAASNAQQEGTAIGAVLGGLAASKLSNHASRYGSFGNQMSGNNFGGGYARNPFVGAGLGAIAGGVLGSNLAASNAQQEGTALGAVLGGVAGYAASNRMRAYASQGGYANSAPIVYAQPQPQFQAQFQPQHQVQPQYQVQNSQSLYGSYPGATTSYHAAPTYHVTGGNYASQTYQMPVQAPQIHTGGYHNTHNTTPYQNVTGQYSGGHSSIGYPIRRHILPAPQSSVYCYAGSGKQYNSAGQLITRTRTITRRVARFYPYACQ